MSAEKRPGSWEFKYRVENAVPGKARCTSTEGEAAHQTEQSPCLPRPRAVDHRCVGIALRGFLPTSSPPPERFFIVSNQDKPDSAHHGF